MPSNKGRCTLPPLCLATTNVIFIRPTLSYQRLQTVQPLSDPELYDKLRRTVPNKNDLQVLEAFLIFNKCAPVPLFAARIRIAVTDECVCVRVRRNVLKTNFYQPTKVALSFRLAPDFLPEVEYPKKPFGMFFVIGMFSVLVCRRGSSA